MSAVGGEGRNVWGPEKRLWVEADQEEGDTKRILVPSTSDQYWSWEGFADTLAFSHQLT